MSRRTSRAGTLERFTQAERWVHRGTAVLLGACLATAAILYFGPLAVLVGRRALVVRVHVLAGLGLPVPALAGWLSAAFRADVRELNRFHPVDGEWLRSRDRRSGRLKVGKFNAGQKLNAAFTVGAIIVMLGTGVIMQYGQHWPLYLRTGATFVHDWLSAAVGVVVLGHLYFAYHDREARRGMRTGQVPASWAQREHRGWAEAVRREG
ncbi:MAG: formate dehydrogenase subunit gamma [Mycobacteriales bacterium]|jgi:formate dehydrogenase subunit gamma